MQVNSINSTSYQQNFGAIKVDGSARELLSKKLATTKAYDEFRELLVKQQHNKFNVNIWTDNLENLRGYVADGSTFYKNFKGPHFFEKPIHWISKMCKCADEQASKSDATDKVLEMLK